MTKKFNIVSNYKPAGDQPKAISEIVAGINAGLLNQTLLGVTGSGKTFAMANIIEELQRPAIVMAHNKKRPTFKAGLGFGSPSWARTSDPMINSHLLYQLSYRGII